MPQNNGKQTYAELHQIADHFIGGNRVENAKDSKVKDFVIANSGHTVITNVSIRPVPEEDPAAEMMGPGRASRKANQSAVHRF